jgi:hypothetical protein
MYTFIIYVTYISDPYTVSYVHIKGRTIAEKSGEFKEIKSSLKIEKQMQQLNDLWQVATAPCVIVTDSMIILPNVERDLLRAGWRRVLAISRAIKITLLQQHPTPH